MAASARRSFIETFGQFPAIKWQQPFPATADRRSSGERVNSVTVVLNLVWPGKLGRPSDNEAYDAIQVERLGKAVFKLKGFIERILAEDIQLLDVRNGCVRVRFRLPDEVDVETVHLAVEGVWANRELYDVVSVEGHVGGRALKVHGGRKGAKAGKRPRSEG